MKDVNSEAYKDSGSIFTIGFGTTYLYDKKRKVHPVDSISMEDAIRYMNHDSAEVIRLANLYIKSTLTSSQATAICDLIYNMGIGNFLKTQLDELINANPDDPKIITTLQGTALKDRLGNLLKGLIRRRKCEAYPYQTGLLRF